MKPYCLSKSKLMSARQCLKRLYLEKNHPELAEVSSKTESAFATGKEIGETAQKLYGMDDAVALAPLIKKTAELVKDGPRFLIFEATFQYNLVGVIALW